MQIETTKIILQVWFFDYLIVRFDCCFINVFTLKSLLFRIVLNQIVLPLYNRTILLYNDQLLHQRQMLKTISVIGIIRIVLLMQNTIINDRVMSKYDRW